MQATISLYDRRNTQREKILELFRLKGFAYTKELIGLGIYQYNARIKELRSQGYEIVAQKINGICAFLYKGIYPPILLMEGKTEKK